MFNILSHKENANQNNTKIPSHLSQIGNQQGNKQQQMLARMWRKRNLHTPLVEMSTIA
jgi:hypothetical protein